MSKKIILNVFILMCFAFAKAQLGFCGGVTGDPIFSEDFGTGITNGPALPAGVTSYNFLNFAPNDGEYTITASTAQRPGWFVTGDHTGNGNGKMLLVNASFNPGLFYRTPISGLCENTPYEFSAWVLNILRGGAANACAGNEVPIQVRFEIWDATDTTILATGSMTPQFATPSPNWVQYGLTFTTTTGQNGVILKMINQGAGGCGNDLAIDDIAFRTCGDATSVATPAGNTTVLQCETDMPQSYTLTASTTTSVFATPVYQWQISTDGVNFTDIAGATTATYTTGVLSSSTFYRVKVAEDAVNLTNTQCVNFSDPWEFRREIVNAPVAVNSRVVVCDRAPGTLEVTVGTGETAAWFNTPTGGTALASGTTFMTSVAGTYYAEAINTASNCRSASRTAIVFAQDGVPQVTSADFEICPDDMQVLDVGFSGGTYLWNTGETTQTITVSTSGTFTCVVTNAAGCDATATFNVTLIELPIIASIDAIGDELTITTVNTGNFSYSIDGFNYQSSPVFNINGLLQITVRVRNNDGCGPVRQQFSRIQIPLFFTPNNDGFHDRWEIYGIEEFPGSRLEIYDRHGKLLQFSTDAITGWDGIYNNQPLPSSDYWYRLYYKDEIIAGHFTLKR
ncbi:MAG: T9SS type B sorting domain-containing protein [Nonlabens sp.]|nr:T9SS type B sorting domain-containing protein [Nonlabens sp.]